ncbi:uncharacterized protein DUF262 [Pontibacter mucosus]|uniref:Uncharacterized protein DUF262 n=1 Tax=Pontibacter mucosus TaxID=1649266 RepID=A0A2T5YDR9_9BACT|nr:DUF262 domain-containing protein [Pontibacter mucosus]PTX14694.1 uncharacterized protein DUF262 [Pontibacter mucosus]
MPNERELLDELATGRKEIKTDSYSMSIGEIINLYKDGEIELDPAFQRLYRWGDEQKSRFIESILLGIPIPPIFVAQKEDGKWTVVDGVQRISTILQLTGELKNHAPLTLTVTKKLPSLEGFDWSSLPEDLKRLLRRSKFDINIILTENSIQAQYELFQRLNSGGLHLEPQEIRNCLIIMLDEEFYDKLNNLKKYPNFIDCLPLQDYKFKIEFHMELILRYMIAKYGKVDFAKYKVSSSLLSEFIDAETANLIGDQDFNFDKEADTFKRVFDLLAKTLGDKAFKKYNSEKDDFDGPFSQSSFDAITPGVAENIDKLSVLSVPEFQQKIKDLYSQKDFEIYSDRGVKALTRIKGLTEFSKAYFQL